MPLPKDTNYVKGPIDAGDGSLAQSQAQFVDTTEANIDSLYTASQNLLALLGVSDTGSDVDLGTFTGSVIGNSVAVKVALQELETALEVLSVLDPGYAVPGTLVAPAAGDELETAITKLHTILNTVISAIGLANDASTNLGSLAGSIVPDGRTVKQAIEDIEGYVTELNVLDPGYVAGSPTAPVAGDSLEAAIAKLHAILNSLDSAITLQGTWDASTGAFPGGGTAQAGYSYIVSVAGTVGGVSFTENDRIIALVDNASTSVFAPNWFKADYTDQVSSVFGRQGAVTATAGDYAASQITNVPSGNVAAVNVQAAINELDGEKIDKSVLIGKGSIVSASAAGVPLGAIVGTDNQYLIANSGTPTGLEWRVPQSTEVAFAPVGTIAATNVQAAIAEVAVDALVPAPTFDSGTTYNTGDRMFNQGIEYIRTAAAGSGAFSFDEWRPVAISTARWRGAWTNSTAYSIDEVVGTGTASAVLYVCTVAHTSAVAGAFAANAITPGGVDVPNWAVANTLLATRSIGPHFVGATGSVPGRRGIVLPPQAGEQNFALMGDGTFGAQVERRFDQANLATSATLTAATTVDVVNYIAFAQTTADVSATIPNPTVPTKHRTIVLENNGTSVLGVLFTSGTGFFLDRNSSRSITWNGSAWVSQDTNMSYLPEFGQSGLFTNAQTIGTTLVDVGNSAFTLPSAGTWEVSYNLVALTNGAGTGNVTVFCTTDANVAVPGSYSVQGGNGAQRAPNTQTFRVTTTGPQAYKLRAQTNSSDASVTSVDSASIGNSSRVIWKKIGGMSPVLGTTVDNVYAVLNNASPIADSAPVVWTDTAGNIPHAGGSFSVKSGRTYLLTAHLYTAANSAWTWRDGGDNNIGNVANANLTGTVSVVWTPSSDTTVRLVNVTSSTATPATIGRCFATIVQIGSSALAPSAWQTYTPTITGASSNPAVGTVVANQARYLYDPLSRTVKINWVLWKNDTSGTTGSGIYSFSMPPGYTLNTSVTGLNNTLNPSSNIPLGSAHISRTDEAGVGYVLAGPDNTRLRIAVNKFTEVTMELWASSHLTLGGGGQAFRRLAVTCEIPVNE
jgi:hypothetical protein